MTETAIIRRTREPALLNCIHACWMKHILWKVRSSSFARRRAGATRADGCRRPAATSACVRVRRVLITPTGLDKGILLSRSAWRLTSKDARYQAQRQPSAETSLHPVIYGERPACARDSACAYDLEHAALGHVCVRAGTCAIEGYEILKGLAGVTTHEHTRARADYREHAGLRIAWRRLGGTLRRRSRCAWGFAEPAWALYLGRIGGRSAPSPGGARVSVRGGGTAAIGRASLRAVGLSSRACPLFYRPNSRRT